MDRYVLPVGTPVVLDDSGFLDVTMGGAWWVAPEDRPVPVTELCGMAGSFVLLGDPAGLFDQAVSVKSRRARWLDRVRSRGWPVQ
jgi:hypothetical protein